MLRLLTTLLTSSLGRKFIMSLSGLGAIGFLAGHLAGNLILYKGESAFNLYAHNLHAIPILPLVELGLAGLFAIHIFFAVWLTLENWSARPVRYQRDESAGGRGVANNTMIWTGLLVGCFMLLHVFGMKFGSFNNLDAYAKVWAVLSNSVIAGIYILGVASLGFHLFHGAKSILQSLGMRHPTYDFWTDLVGRVAGVVIALGFLSIPIYILIKGGMAK